MHPAFHPQGSHFITPYPLLGCPVSLPVRPLPCSNLGLSSGLETCASNSYQTPGHPTVTSHPMHPFLFSPQTCSPPQPVPFFHRTALSSTEMSKPETGSHHSFPKHPQKPVNGLHLLQTSYHHTLLFSPLPPPQHKPPSFRSWIRVTGCQSLSTPNSTEFTLQSQGSRAS